MSVDDPIVERESESMSLRNCMIGVAAALLIAAAVPNPVRAAADSPLAAAYNDTGQALFRRLRALPASGNVVLSPFSIGSALAMALEGARGDTRREMASVMTLRSGRTDVAAAQADLLATLNGYDRGEAPACPPGLRWQGEACMAAPENDRCPRGARRDGAHCVAPPLPSTSARLRVANALMLGQQTGGMIAPAYVALLESKFAAEVFRDAGLAEVNAWVKERTEGKIEKLLEQLDPSVAAVILNAVYFKAGWRTPFDANVTAPADFNLSPSRKEQVATMRLRSPFALQSGDGYRAIRVPYKVAALSMTVVLPARIDGVDAVADRLDAPELTRLFAALRAAPPVQVALMLPRFKTSFRASLREPLQQLGMKKAFDLRRADFSGMTGRPPAEARLAIDNVIHQAVVDVTEAGTEAAAATAITMMTTSAPSKVETFEIDRPFLFYITDDATGAILFQGRIVDPR